MLVHLFFEINLTVIFLMVHILFCGEFIATMIFILEIILSIGDFIPLLIYLLLVY